MDQKAFDFVAEKVGSVLSGMGYVRQKTQQGDAGPEAVFLGGEMAYQVAYENGRKRFELRSGGVEDGKPQNDWKTLSMWLFDPETDSQSQAQSIVDDFVETVRGPQQLAAVKTRKKRKKDDENNVDPLFFFNRFVGIFPELKEEITAEKAQFGDVRAVTFARVSLLPKIAALCAKPGEKDRTARCCSLLNDMYIAGDMDVRSLITIVILNGLDRDILENIKPQFNDELKKSCKAAFKLRGKTVKPEKRKKQKKFMADTLNSLNR